MYTPTHLTMTLAVLAIWQRLMQNRQRAALLWAGLGSVFPDIPLIIQLSLNWLYGAKFLLAKNSTSAFLGEMFHSLVLWLCVWLIAETIISFSCQSIWKAVRFLCLGVIGHILVDAMTHGSGQYGNTYMWPVDIRLGKLIGFCTYFTPGKEFSVKWWELLIFIFSTAIVVKHISYQPNSLQPVSNLKSANER